jgi:hypothetical protein
MIYNTERLIKQLSSYIGWILVLSALGFYIYGIVGAIVQTVGSTSTKSVAYPSFLANTIGSLQALLLTNLGVLLGISVVKPASGIARALRLSSQEDTDKEDTPSPKELSQTIQLFALVIFVICLIACLITWIVKCFSEDTKLVVPIISDSGKTFSAVVIAYVTSLFAKNGTS